MQLRPVLTYLDDMDAKTKASTKKMADMDKPAQAEVTKAIQVPTLMGYRALITLRRSSSGRRRPRSSCKHGSTRTRT